MEDIRAWLFTMLAWNMHGGVAEKLSDPSITSMLYGADIVVLSETWLDEHAAKGTSLPGYGAHHCYGVSSPHVSPLLCLRRGLRTVQAGQGASEPASSTLESTSVAASEISFSDKSPRAQANAQHQRPLFGPSFEGEARGDREPAAPMRAVEEVEFRPADGPGQDSAGALDCGHILGGLPDDQVHGSGQ